MGGEVRESGERNSQRTNKASATPRYGAQLTGIFPLGVVTHKDAIASFVARLNGAFVLADKKGEVGYDHGRRGWKDNDPGGSGRVRASGRVLEGQNSSGGR